MRAFGERIIVEKILEDNKIGAVTVSTEKTYNNTVTVISIGEEVISNLSVGDTIKLSDNSGVDMKYECKDYLAIVKQNILAYI